MTTNAGRFVPTYSAELAQYVVQRGELWVVPTRANAEDDTCARAARLAVTLNQLYATEAQAVACSATHCVYPECNCPLAVVPLPWMRDPTHAVERLRTADGADLADTQDDTEEA